MCLLLFLGETIIKQKAKPNKIEHFIVTIMFELQLLQIEFSYVFVLKESEKTTEKADDTVQEETGIKNKCS